MFTRCRLALLLSQVAWSAAAVANCTGASTRLPADQCAAWGAFFNTTNVVAAGHCKKDMGWLDPCACKGFGGQHPVCNEDGTFVQKMYVPPECRPNPYSR
jgi:hypothetical protein